MTLAGKDDEYFKDSLGISRNRTQTKISNRGIEALKMALR